MKVESILDCVGDTPLLKVNNIMEKHDLKANLYVKLEMFNASGSVKMRIVKSIILDGINSGKINEDTMIVEATSGNVGIALACLCARLNLKLTIVMPETASIERKKLIKLYGANLILTQGHLGMDGAVQEVNNIVKNNKNTFVLSQFNNYLNPLTHQLTTAREIYDDLAGEVDIVVCGIGSGGTITGIAKYLHMVGETEVIGVEPTESPLISKGISGGHKIEGIGANFIPEILKLDEIDKIITVDYNQAINGVKMLAMLEGVTVGISAGAAFMVGFAEALKSYNYNKNIVVVLADNIERYFSKTEGGFL